MTATRLRQLIFIALFYSLTVLAESPPVVVFSYEDSSCGAWANSADEPAVRWQYHSWFRGFVSGYNYGNPNNQIVLGQMPNPQTLDLFVDKYCRDNPLKPFVWATVELIKELAPPASKKNNNH